MKRTMVISLVLITLAAGVAVAQPWGGDAGFSGGPWAQGEAPELETLEGRLRLAEDERPVLVAGGEEYTLAIHPALVAELSVSNGQSVTVEGFVTTFPSRDLLGDERVVHVRAFEAGGTRVVIPEGVGPAGGRMGGRPMAGGRGAAGPMGRPGGAAGGAFGGRGR